MSFKSKTDWPDFSPKLPTRHGVAQGHSAENKMLFKTPSDGIRTQIRNNPDGSVTMLRTRNGWPEFTTIKTVSVAVAEQVRGFTLSGVNPVVVFDCFSKTAVGTTTIAHATYAVADFVSLHKLAAPEWGEFNDVWAVVGAKVYVNGTISRGVLYPASGQEERSIPVIIPNGAEPRYSGAVGFAVGRFSVVAPDGSSVQLTPTTPRDDRKALVMGQKIHGADNATWLSQLWFTGDMWDDIGSGWAISQLRVVTSNTLPYLTSTPSSFPVVLATCVPQSTGTVQVAPGYRDTGSVQALLTLYGTFVGQGGSGPVWQTIATANTPYYGPVKHGVNFYGSTSSYEQNIDDVSDYLGDPVSSHQSSTITITTQHEQGTQPAQNIVVPNRYDIDTFYKTDVVLRNSSWDSNLTPYGRDISVAGYSRYGEAYISLNGFALGDGMQIDTSVSDYSGEFSVSYQSRMLTQGSFSRVITTGGTYSVTPRPFDFYFHGTTFTESSGWAWPMSLEEAASYIVPTIASWEGCKCIWNDPNYYQPSQVRVDWAIEENNSDASMLQWATIDHVLLDAENSVFIFLKSEFSATQTQNDGGTGTLVVTLEIEAPTGNASISVFSTTLTGFGQILPLSNDAPTRVPMPRLSAFPGSIYYHQGAFRGVAYTEASETCAPACLMDFSLRVSGFGAIGETNPDTDSSVVLVPANLLEMLYAYVFSDQYGQNDYERYPVTRMDWYVGMSESLFNTDVHVQYANGAVGAWVTSVTGKQISNLELGRL